MEIYLLYCYFKMLGIGFNFKGMYEVNGII